MASASTEGLPWSFTVTFDEVKVWNHGYDSDALYECVGKNVESLDNVRVGRGTWQAKEGVDEVEAQCLSLSALSKQRWVMENISSLVFFEDDQEPNGFIAITRRTNPERICS